jgi:excisionase family DNA binding protein
MFYNLARRSAPTEASKDMSNLRDFITIREAADLIGVSPATLRNWDRSGKLKAVRNPMNRYRLYRREDLDALLAGLATGKQAGSAKRARTAAPRGK